MLEEELKGFKFEKEIGKGAFSKVLLATRLDTGEKCAIKKIDKSFTNNKTYKKYLNNEIFILNNIKHQNIIKFYGMKVGMNYIYLIFEYINGGDLQSCLNEYLKRYDKPFSQDVVQHIMKQVISGFVYLHGRKILHRDIKLENILVKFPTEGDRQNLNMLKTEIKITDFGFSRFLKGDSLAKSLLGNPINMDPHILRKMARIDNDTEFGYDEKADVWSLGTVTYELLVGYPAYEASSYEELIQKIEEGNYKIPHEIILSKEAISFLNGMMRYEPKTRLSVEELSKQYFLTKDPSTFHPVQLKKARNDLAQSIMLNSKEEKNNNIKDLWSIYESNVDIENINPEDTMDTDSICNPGRLKKITEDPHDIVGEQLENQVRDENYNRVEQNNNINKIQEKINTNTSDYLQNCFDQMNKDCFYIEPLLIPTQPFDSYNSEDPISKFMDKL
jgi:serine/threonine protein kinase